MSRPTQRPYMAASTTVANARAVVGKNVAGESRIAVLAAFFGNLIIVIGKLTAGLAAGSAAMMAEAAHSFSDVVNQVLLMVGMARSKQAPSQKYPFGTGTVVFLTAHGGGVAVWCRWRVFPV
jgi:divalent metal cation (Fe/Co/Zn/Cd) transporter